MLPRMRTLSSLLCAAFALTFLCAPAGTQNSHNRADKAQADLHINVIVAPMVFPPGHHKDKDRDRDEAAVTYNLSTSPEKFSITEEMRSMLVDGVRHDQVQLTTIVVK